MEVKVTIQISQESLTEVAEAFYQVYRRYKECSPGTPGSVAAVQTAQVAPVPPMPAQNPPQGPIQGVPQPQGSAVQAAPPQIPVQPPVGAPIPGQAVPTTAVAQEYSQDQVAVAMTGLIDTGKREAVLQILGMFGAQALTQIPKERYPELVLKLREAGANI